MCLCTVVCVWFSGWPAGPALSAPLPPEPRALRVIARTIEPAPVVGELLDFSTGTGATIRSLGEKQHVAYDRLITLTFAGPTDTTDAAYPGGPALPVPPRGPLWSLANGDVVVGPVIESTEDAVTIDVPALGRLAIPTERIRRFAAPAVAGGSYQETAAWFDREPLAEDDAVLLTNGDVLKGLIRSFDRDGLMIETIGGESRVPYRLVVVARLANPPSPAAGKRAVRVSFRQGARLSLGALEIHGQEVVARDLADNRLEFSTAGIERLEIVGGRWEWLGDHQPVSFQHVPMLGLGWEYKIDRNVLDGPIKVAGRTFDHGIGVHSQSRLAFELKGAYVEFVTSFGMDDSAGPLADATTVILVDGQKRYTQEHVRPGRLSEPVRLDVSKANRLELVVEFGDHGDVQDRFNWVEPGLVRAP